MTLEKDRILIQKENIPYRFYIGLPKTEYELEIQYNEYADLFTIGLYKNKEKLCIEPIVYNRPLFRQLYQPGLYPAITIVPADSGDSRGLITWDDFGETIFLTIDNAGR